MDKCYVVQIFGLDSDQGLFPDIPAPFSNSPLFSEEEERERDRVLKALTIEDRPILNIGLFVCRTLEKAKDIMLDTGFVQTDWVNCYREKDSEGSLFEIYLSTDRHYLCRLFRTILH